MQQSGRDRGLLALNPITPLQRMPPPRIWMHKPLRLLSKRRQRWMRSVVHL